MISDVRTATKRCHMARTAKQKMKIQSSKITDVRHLTSTVCIHGWLGSFTG